MYGAILGDIIGSPYEFDRGNKTKDFPLFVRESHFTDDTVMTIAVAEALIEAKGYSLTEIKAAVAESMMRWGKQYVGAGYGKRFAAWLFHNMNPKDPQPYGSYGNGSAMRVSAAGWLYDTLEESRSVARATAEVTHNHPEGIKGAEATASAIFLARTGSSKEEIKEYIIREFGYDLSRTCDEIRPTYHHVESCQKTVPEAITAFLEGQDFEDVIRTAVSLGGDCDTLACIAGSIAEAFYGVPALLENECRNRLPDDILNVLERFDGNRGRENAVYHDTFLDGNELIEEAIDRFKRECTKENLELVINLLRFRMQNGGHFLIPVENPNPPLVVDIEHAKVGDVLISEEDSHFTLQRVLATDGSHYLAAFTSRREYEQGPPSSLISYFMDAFLMGCLNAGEENGIILNPWGKSLTLTMDLIRIIAKAENWSIEGEDNG